MSKNKLQHNGLGDKSIAELIIDKEKMVEKLYQEHL